MIEFGSALTLHVEVNVTYPWEVAERVFFKKKKVAERCNESFDTIRSILSWSGKKERQE
jgi:hypothetical protein